MFDPADINKENYGEENNVVYINRWADIAPGNQVKEMKDMKEITALEVNCDGNNFINMKENTNVYFTYIITPFDATNKNLYWFSTSPVVSINDDTNEPGRAQITAGSVSGLTNAKVTVYSESGQHATINVTVKKANE